jgi:hypothetical protein
MKEIELLSDAATVALNGSVDELNIVGVYPAPVGLAEPLDWSSVPTFEHLRTMARKVQLDFISQERKRPLSSRASSIRLIAERGAPLLPPDHEIQHIKDSNCSWVPGLQVV